MRSVIDIVDLSEQELDELDSKEIAEIKRESEIKIVGKEFEYYS